MVNRPWCCLLVLLFQFHGSEEAKYWFRPHQQAGLSAPPEDRHGSDGHHVLWRQPDVKPSASARHVLAHSPPYQRGNSKPTAFIQSTGKRKEGAPTASVIIGWGIPSRLLFTWWRHGKQICRVGHRDPRWPVSRRRPSKCSTSLIYSSAPCPPVGEEKSVGSWRQGKQKRTRRIA